MVCSVLRHLTLPQVAEGEIDLLNDETFGDGAVGWAVRVMSASMCDGVRDLM